MAVRKLLVASQKGDVGKTTTSVNLAAAAAAAGARVLLFDADPLSSISAALNLGQRPERQPLRQIGVDLPGVLVANVVPGLDVLSPYEEGGCSDDELDRLLNLLGEPALRAHYGCLVVGAPPFLGANPAQLTGVCDGMVLVMRAEPMAYRTLPAFLELVQRSKKSGHKPLPLRGILLTLPENEPPGGRWERELRGRLGSRVLPQVVPYDEEVGKALLSGQIVSHVAPGSPAAVQYHSLAQALDLTAEAGQQAQAEKPAAALWATLTVRAPSQSGVRPRVQVAAPARARRTPTPVPASAAPTPPPTPALSVEETPVEEPALDQIGANAPVPSRLVSAVELPVLTQLPPFEPKEERPRARVRPKPKDQARRAPLVNLNSKSPLLIWLGLGVVLVLGLRLFPLPPVLVHLAFGGAVAGAVFLLLRLLSAPEPQPVELNPQPEKDRPAGRKPGEPRKAPPSRTEGKKAPDTRLATLSRRAPGGPRRDPKR
jgi:chromosome partitioning protein